MWRADAQRTRLGSTSSAPRLGFEPPCGASWRPANVLSQGRLKVLADRKRGRNGRHALVTLRQRSAGMISVTLSPTQPVFELGGLRRQPGSLRWWLSPVTDWQPELKRLLTDSGRGSLKRLCNLGNRRLSSRVLPQRAHVLFCPGLSFGTLRCSSCHFKLSLRMHGLMRAGSQPRSYGLIGGGQPKNMMPSAASTPR